jgi:hypothetical protein
MSHRLQPYTIIKAVTTAGTAVQLTATPTYVPWFEFWVDDGNTGANMYFGDSSVDNTYIPRAKGDTAVVTASSDAGYQKGDMIDLSKVWLDSDSDADSMVIQFFAP